MVEQRLSGGDEVGRKEPEQWLPSPYRYNRVKELRSSGGGTTA